MHDWDQTIFYSIYTFLCITCKNMTSEYISKNTTLKELQKRFACNSIESIFLLVYNSYKYNVKSKSITLIKAFLAIGTEFPSVINNQFS